MPPKISKLTMTGFRGATTATTISFDASRPVVLIFGENGTGKSTIADAFDFICNRSFGSLENFSLGEPAKKHVASLGVKPVDISVTLESGARAWQATMGKDGPTVSPLTDLPNARVLRRRTILSLIETQPKQRFDALKAFIAVPNIEKCEAALRDAVTSTNNAVIDLARATVQATDELTKLWDAEGQPGVTATAWATSEAAKDISKLQKIVDEIDAILRSYHEVETALKTLDEALAEHSSAAEALSAAQVRRNQAESYQSQQNAGLLKLLQEARDYVKHGKSSSKCPVCEQEVDMVRLDNRLEARIGEMQELVLVTSKAAAAQSHADSKRVIVNEARRDFCQKTGKLAALLKPDSFFAGRPPHLDWARYEVLLGAPQPSGTIEQLARDFYRAVSVLCEPMEADRSAAQKSIHQHSAIAGHVGTLKEKTERATAQQKLLTDLKSALEIVMKQRKDYVEDVLATISTEAEALYAKLHPGEGIGQLKFHLNPKTIGSLEFDAQFHDADRLPPQAYYSESHLDTLGICVFMALAKHFKTDNTVVVLDDVLTSVDGPHLTRFMAMLHDQAKHFNQLIITTHYRPWLDRYRWAKGSASNTQVIELRPWSLQNGLQTGEFLTAVAELKAALAQPMIDRQAAASKAGIVLEWLLNFVTLKYHCAIPRNARNEYTLGDLVSGVNTKLGKELRCHKPTAAGGPKTEVLLKPLFDAATASQWIRNSVGCHFNALGSEVYDTDVKDFCQHVLTLASHLICEICKTLPTHRPHGSYWECKCGEFELYPLIYPGADPRTVDEDES